MKLKALISAFLIAPLGVFAQTNLDFETGDLTGWTCETGCAPNYATYPSYGGDGYNNAGPNCNGGWVASGPVAGRHTVVNASGTAFCNTGLSLNPGGVGSKILKLGNEQVYSYAERVSNTIAVTESNCIITLKYAVMLQDGPYSPHANAADEAYFLIELFDQSNALMSCPAPTKVNYSSYASSFTLPSGYYGGPPCWAIGYIPWITQTINLSGYVGQNVTLRLTTADCAVGGDAAIAYVDVSYAALPVTASTALCNGGTVTLTAPSGSGYNWLPGAQTTQAITAGASASNYTVTYTDGSNCPKRAKYSVAEPTAVTGAANITSNVLCNGGTSGVATASGSGGTGSITYTWSPGNLTGATQNTLSANTYTVTISDANGCTTQDTVLVQQPTSAIVTSSTTKALCNGQNSGTATVNVTGGTPGYTYTWMPGNLTGASQSNLGATSYTVNVYDANSCAATHTLTITEPTLLTASATGASVNCFGDATASVSVSPTGGTAPYTYSWTGGPQTANYNNVGAGTYNVTITDSAGCTATISAVVTGPSDYPSVFASVNNNVLCYGAGNGSATAVGSGGTGTITYTWTPGNLSGATQSNLSPTTYTITINDANGCQNDTTITITEPQVLTATPNVTSDVKCFGQQNGAAGVTVNGGTQSYSYSWNPGNYTSASSNSLGAGNYIITITDANGCDTTTSITITEPTQLTANASATDANCNGESTGSVSTNVPNTGTPPYTYMWNTNNNTTSVDSLPAGTYTVTITDANQCTATATASINQPQVFNVLAVDTDITCGGLNNGIASASVTGGNGGETYNWTPGNINTPTISNLAPGNYTVNVTDSKGCTATNTVTITEPTPLSVNSASATTCQDQPLVLNAPQPSGGSGNYTYTWMPSNTNGSTYTVNLDSSVTYWLIVNDGCSSDTAVFTVTVNTKPNADFTASPYSTWSEDQIVFTDNSTDLNGATWNWNFNDGNTATGNQTVHAYEASGIFPVTLIVTNSNGCIDTITKNIEIKERLIVPNVFTPNNDGSNDSYIITNSGVRDYKIVIYDRWGLKMFESSDSKVHWDGNTQAGKPAPDGTYYYILQATFYSERKEDLKGYLQLIRGQ